MKKITQCLLVFVTAFLISGAVTVQAQNLSQDFEGYSAGDSLATIGWSVSDIQAKIVDSSGNKVLQNTIHNYNAAPVLKVVLPSGKTLADYGKFKFKAYFAQGDVGYKDIVVEAYQTMPTAQFANNAAAKIGSWTRSQMGSTAWENITVDITNTSSLHDTIYVAFGINCAGTGDVGGTGVTTVWYADNVILAPGPLVSMWGKTNLGTAWPIIPSATSGNAGLGNGAVPTGWATIRGQFDTLTATTTQAVVVSGQMQFVGGGGASAYTWLRYGLTFQDSATLNYAGTDSANWTSPDKNYGYSFQPRSGAGTMSNGGGGQGTVWTVNNGNWTSTYSNNGGPVSAVTNQPRNAEAIAGTYNFAMSVISVNDTVNELRWYLVETSNKYWFGGTIMVQSTSKKFNSICFGFNNDFQGTQVNFTGVTAQLGTPITVPVAPFAAFYVDDWGKTSLGKAWPIGWNDTTYLVGDADLGSGTARPTGAATIRGGFGLDPMTISTTKAIIVSGQMQFVGGGGASAYTWLRYGLTFQDSTKLKYKGTDSAVWVNTVDTLALKGNYGYSFQPRSGAGTMSNGNGGQGTVWTVNNGNWNSTYSNNGGPIAAVLNQPRNAEAIAGTYNWAISVQSVNDTVNEIRWYLVEQNNKYWFAGTVQALSTTKKFNGICFYFNNDFQGTQVKFMAVKVDLGAPIPVPLAPWNQYYVENWGIFGPIAGGWKYQVDPDSLVGNAGMGSTAANTAMVALRGAIEPFSPSTTRGLKVTGDIILAGGGFEAANSLRVGLLNGNAGNVVGSGDSTRWSGVDTGHTGILFIPRSGSTANPAWGNSTNGTAGVIAGGTWSSPSGNASDASLGQFSQQPTDAVGSAGTYSFALSVVPQSGGTSDISFSLNKSGYHYAAKATKSNQALVSTFNGIAFALNSGNTTTSLTVQNLLIDTTTVPVNVGTVTGVQADEQVIPKVFALAQNYPNPFNPSTTISYDIPKAAFVTLRIYDVLGRLVTTLVDGVKAPSSYKMQWNASNLSSGVYFYRISARSQDGSGDFTSVKKLILMK